MSDVSPTRDRTMAPGAVERECALCGWRGWYDSSAPEAEITVFVCEACKTDQPTRVVCSACNLTFTLGWRALTQIPPSPKGSRRGERWFRCHRCTHLQVGTRAPRIFCQRPRPGAIDSFDVCGQVAVRTLPHPHDPRLDIDLCEACANAQENEEFP